MNVSNIISRALKQLGVLAAGESASAEEVADAVDALRSLLAQWATDRLMVYKVQEISLDLTGIGTYTLSQTVDSISDKAKLDDQDIMLIRDLNNTGSYRPVIYTVDEPYWHFNVLKDAKKLVLNTFTLPTTLNAKDEIDFPAKYERPLILSLAVEIAPMFGITEPSVLMLTNQARAIEALKRSNSTPIYAHNDLPVGVRKFHRYEHY